jgi:hypothetical protein
MSSYLSIDLDFWKEHKDTKSATRLFRKVLGLNAPVTFVIEHEELVADIKKVKKLDTLYNIDYHSDIIAQEDCSHPDPEDYNWANYIPQSHKADFYWILPNMKCNDAWEGLCHADGINPFNEPERSGWKSCQIKTQSFVDWRNIERVGVCLSPIWVSLKTVKPVIKKLGVNIDMVEELISNQPEQHSMRRRGVLTKIKAA